MLEYKKIGASIIDSLHLIRRIIIVLYLLLIYCR